MGFAAVAAAFAAVSTVSHIVTAKAAAKQADKQFKQSQEEAARGRAAQKQLADIQTMRDKRATAREAQAKKANILSAGEAQGVSGSSAVQGSTAAVTTQAGSNVSFLDTANQLQSTASTAFGNAQDIARKPIDSSDAFGDITGAIAGTLFSGRKELKTFFDS